MLANWNGLFPALWTATDGSVRPLGKVIAAQVKFLRGSGVDGLMVLGSTGEFAHLDLPARKEVVRCVVEAAPGLPLIVNCSDVNPVRSADLGRFARELDADAIALLPPWFYPVSEEDAAEFMVRVAEASGLPLVIYNFPELTGHRLSMATIATVCARVPVVAVKQSGGEFEYHRELARLGQEKHFVLITGSDTRLFEAFSMGARGLVSGLANAVPEWMANVFQTALRGEPEGSVRDAAGVRELAACVNVLPFPLNVAAALQARGRPTGEFKQALSADTLARFAEVVNQARRILGPFERNEGGWT